VRVRRHSRERLQVVAQYLNEPVPISYMFGLEQISVSCHGHQKGFHVYETWKILEPADETWIGKSVLFRVLRKMEAPDVCHSHKNEFVSLMVIDYVMTCTTHASFWNDDLQGEERILMSASDFWNDWRVGEKEISAEMTTFSTSYVFPEYQEVEARPKGCHTVDMC
jgi:hypothetical protein